MYDILQLNEMLVPELKDIAEQLKVHSRNLKNVLIYLEDHHNIFICKRTLQNFLKDTGLHLEKSPAISKKQTEPGRLWN